MGMIRNAQRIRRLRGRRPVAKQPAVRFRAPARRKKGRTGTKRRAVRGVMVRHPAPVNAGYSVTHGRKGPAGVGYSMRQVSDTCTRITGRAYVGEVNTKGKIATGTSGNCLGLIFDVNPALLNDRVAVIASTFEKYVYHGMKFTYVPQCATSTSGSVGMVFDRDPLQYSANASPSGTQFLSEVMSYEHAVLTPGYVEASTAYARDPKELKTWFLGATDATLTTRETSQGNLLVYLSNAVPNTGYGFIVMDYVLDLVAPNLLPNKQNVTNIKSGPSQWRDFNGSVAGSTQFNATGVLIPIGTGTATGSPYFYPATGWVNAVGPANLRVGVVGEFQIGGMATDNATAIAPTFFPADQPTTAYSVANGQKLYFCVHVLNQVDGSDTPVVTFHLTLGSARAAASYVSIGQNSTTPTVVGDMLFAAAANDTRQIGGWLRLITDGAGVVDSA